MARRVHQVVHMCSIRPLVVVFSIVCVAASVTDSSAQPYVYALVSGGAVEQGGLYQIPLTPRIATVDTATGQVLSSTPLTGCVTPKSFATIPTDGSTIDVVIDNVIVGHPIYNQPRSDISSLFPSYTNSGGPVGYQIFDSRTLANGLHSIAWVIRDSAGNATAVGSRYFTVANP